MAIKAISLATALAVPVSAFPGWAAAAQTARGPIPSLPAPVIVCPPQSAAAGLKSVASAVMEEQRQPQAGRPSAAARSFFDAGGAEAAAAVTLAVAATAVSGGLALPAGYALARYAGQRNAQPETALPLGRRLIDNFESHIVVGIGLGAALGAASAPILAGTQAFPLIMAAIGYGTAYGMERYLGHLRRTSTVGGWQASHDMAMRVDPADGELRDVRGRQGRSGYGNGYDRYDVYAPGPVSAGERLWARLVGIGLGAAWLSSAWAYGLALTLAFALRDRSLES